jgi:hypothetical protein
MDEAAHEAIRRGAQRAAALAVVFFAGGYGAAKTIVRLNGLYGDEFFAMLLYLVSFVSLVVWFTLFCVWLTVTIATRRHKATISAIGAWRSTPTDSSADARSLR